MMQTRWRTAQKITAIIGLSLFFLGCSPGRDSGDGGLFDGDDRPDGGDESAHPEGITLRIPQGLELCNMEGVRNQLDLPYLKLRLGLRGGDFSLPLDRQEFALDLVERLKTSPDGSEATAAGPGEFYVWRANWGPGYPTYCVFEYRQPFQIDAGAFTAGFGFFLECEAGAVWELPDNLGPAMYPCGGLESYTAGRVVATVTNGDRVEFDYYSYEGCSRWVGVGLCPMFMGDPSRGRFARGPQERATTNYYGLALACGHHLGPKIFLMVFDQPQDGVFGVVLNDDGPVPAEVQYLDADLAVVATEDVVDIRYE